MDKFKHFYWLGMGGGFIAMLFISNPILAGLIGGTLMGLIKDVIDKTGAFYQKKTGFDVADLLYTADGGLFIGLLYYFPNLIDYLKTTETLL